MSVKTIFRCNGCDATIEQTELQGASWVRLSVRDNKATPLAIRSADAMNASAMITRDDHVCSVGCMALCLHRFADALASSATVEEASAFKLDAMPLR